MAEFQVKNGKVVLTLSKSEAKGLCTLADEGKLGLMTDEAAARAYLGTKAQQDAAERGWEALMQATANL